MQHTLRGKVVSPGAESRDISLAELWLVIRKRRILLLSMAVGCAALAIGAGILHGKRYTAAGELQIQPNAAADLKSSVAAAMGGSGGSFDDTMESDVHILESPTLLTQVAQTLKLQDNPNFVGKNAAHPNRDLSNPYVAASVVGALRANLTVERVPGTQIISIQYKSSSPQLSADVVNALESQFIENNFITHYNTTKEVTKWLTGQMDDLRTAVQTSQDEMVNLQRKLGMYAFDPQHTLMVQQIGDLDKQISDTTEQRVLAEARYRILASLPPDQIVDSNTPLGSESGLLTSLRSQRDAAAAELAQEDTF